MFGIGGDDDIVMVVSVTAAVRVAVLIRSNLITFIADGSICGVGSSGGLTIGFFGPFFADHHYHLHHQHKNHHQKLIIFLLIVCFVVESMVFVVLVVLVSLVGL